MIAARLRVRSRLGRSFMCAILARGRSMDAGRFTEAPEKIGSKLETGALCGQRSRNAQPQRPVEAVLARASLDHVHDGRGIDAGLLLEQHRAALRPEIEPAHPESARRELEPGDAQEALRGGRAPAETILDLGGESIERRVAPGGGHALVRSEEHTSE